MHDRISPELGQRDKEPLIIAHRASVFYGTDLQVRLSAQGIDTLILVGVASTGVMLSTIAHASDADYRLYSVRTAATTRTRWCMNTCSPPPSNRAPRCCRWRTPWRCCADRPWPARTASPPETRMETIEGQTFLMSYDKGGSHFHDLHLRDCTFDNGALSMVKHPKRMSRVRNLRLSQCSAINSMIRPCVFEDVLVEDLSTNPILLVWASFFRRVTLRGKIGKINLNLVPEAFCTDAAILDQFAQARAAFYAETDWALDISEAKLLGLRCEGVPLHLIRRDPQTQVILDKQGRYRGQQVLDQSFAQAFPVTDSVLRGFDESDTQSMLLTASLGAPRREQEKGAIAELRRLGFVEE